MLKVVPPELFGRDRSIGQECPYFKSAVVEENFLERSIISP